MTVITSYSIHYTKLYDDAVRQFVDGELHFAVEAVFALDAHEHHAAASGSELRLVGVGVELEIRLAARGLDEVP